jgi:hypothetical protein
LTTDIALADFTANVTDRLTTTTVISICGVILITIAGRIKLADFFLIVLSSGMLCCTGWWNLYALSEVKHEDSDSTYLNFYWITMKTYQVISRVNVEFWRLSPSH